LQLNHQVPSNSAFNVKPIVLYTDATKLHMGVNPCNPQHNAQDVASEMRGYIRWLLAADIAWDLRGSRRSVDLLQSTLSLIAEERGSGGSALTGKLGILAAADAV
jgi:hypothetical protein